MLLYYLSKDDYVDDAVPRKVLEIVDVHDRGQSSFEIEHLGGKSYFCNAASPSVQSKWMRAIQDALYEPIRIAQDEIEEAQRYLNSRALVQYNSVASAKSAIAKAQQCAQTVAEMDSLFRTLTMERSECERALYHFQALRSHSQRIAQESKDEMISATAELDQKGTGISSRRAQISRAWLATAQFEMEHIQFQSHAFSVQQLQEKLQCIAQKSNDIRQKSRILEEERHLLHQKAELSFTKAQQCKQSMQKNLMAWNRPSQKSPERFKELETLDLSDRIFETSYLDPLMEGYLLCKHLKKRLVMDRRYCVVFGNTLCFFQTADACLKLPQSPKPLLVAHVTRCEEWNGKLATDKSVCHPFSIVTLEGHVLYCSAPTLSSAQAWVTALNISATMPAMSPRRALNARATRDAHTLALPIPSLNDSQLAEPECPINVAVLSDTTAQSEKCAVFCEGYLLMPSDTIHLLRIKFCSLRNGLLSVFPSHEAYAMHKEDSCDVLLVPSYEIVCVRPWDGHMTTSDKMPLVYPNGIVLETKESLQWPCSAPTAQEKDAWIRAGPEQKRESQIIAATDDSISNNEPIRKESSSMSALSPLEMKLEIIPDPIAVCVTNRYEAAVAKTQDPEPKEMLTDTQTVHQFCRQKFRLDITQIEMPSVLKTEPSVPKSEPSEPIIEKHSPLESELRSPDAINSIPLPALASEPLFMEGYLIKRGHQFPSMRKRYCILQRTNQKLSYFVTKRDAEKYIKDPASLSATGAFQVKSVTDWNGKTLGQTYPFGMEIQAMDNTLYFCAAPSLQEKIEWVRGLNNAIMCRVNEELNTHAFRNRSDSYWIEDDEDNCNDALPRHQRHKSECVRDANGNDAMIECSLIPPDSESLRPKSECHEGTVLLRLKSLTSQIEDSLYLVASGVTLTAYTSRESYKTGAESNCIMNVVCVQDCDQCRFEIETTELRRVQLQALTEAEKKNWLRMLQNAVNSLQYSLPEAMKMLNSDTGASIEVIVRLESTRIVVSYGGNDCAYFVTNLLPLDRISQSSLREIGYPFQLDTIEKKRLRFFASTDIQRARWIISIRAVMGITVNNVMSTKVANHGNTDVVLQGMIAHGIQKSTIPKRSELKKGIVTLCEEAKIYFSERNGAMEIVQRIMNTEIECMLSVISSTENVETMYLCFETITEKRVWKQAMEEQIALRERMNVSGKLKLKGNVPDGTLSVSDVSRCSGTLSWWNVPSTNSMWPTLLWQAADNEGSQSYQVYGILSILCLQLYTNESGMKRRDAGSDQDLLTEMTITKMMDWKPPCEDVLFTDSFQLQVDCANRGGSMHCIYLSIPNSECKMNVPWRKAIQSQLHIPVPPPRPSEHCTLAMCEPIEGYVWLCEQCQERKQWCERYIVITFDSNVCQLYVYPASNSSKYTLLKLNNVPVIYTHKIRNVRPIWYDSSKKLHTISNTIVKRYQKLSQTRAGFELQSIEGVNIECKVDSDKEQQHYLHTIRSFLPRGKNLNALESIPGAVLEGYIETAPPKAPTWKRVFTTKWKRNYVVLVPREIDKGTSQLDMVLDWYIYGTEEDALSSATPIDMHTIIGVQDVQDNQEHHIFEVIRQTTGGRSVAMQCQATSGTEMTHWVTVIRDILVPGESHDHQAITARLENVQTDARRQSILIKESLQLALDCRTDSDDSLSENGSSSGNKEPDSSSEMSLSRSKGTLMESSETNVWDNLPVGKYLSKIFTCRPSNDDDVAKSLCHVYFPDANVDFIIRNTLYSHQEPQSSHSGQYYTCDYYSQDCV